jgi:lipopolysaccharide/colanic/teichoic acid biosynthesis glycosyltransferase
VSHPSIAGREAWPIVKPVVRPSVSLLERTLAVGLLILLSPVLVLVFLAVWILSGRTPLIAHRRVGQHGVEFWMLKVRTMWDGRMLNCARSWVEHLADTPVPVLKIGSDPRVTSRFAALCRRFSLDELPQLLHVVTGRMRLVGPRPITRAEWNAYYGEAAISALSVPPGITGLWQVKGRNRLSYAQRRRLDLFYARHRSVILDLMILLRTPARVLSGRDAC